jgi:hypothetical protein
MKILILCALSTSFNLGISAQKVNYKKVIEITKAEFDKHLAVPDVIVKSSKAVKSKGIIYIKTLIKTIVLKDDGEMKQYIYEGVLMGTQLILIHELEPNTEEYYFINKRTGTIDTLLYKPVFCPGKSDVVCLEGKRTDMKQRIQVGRIKNGRFIASAYFMISDEINPDDVYWFNKNIIFFDDNDKFYKLTF